MEYVKETLKKINLITGCSKEEAEKVLEMFIL